jgi:hypothetical protein
MPNISFCHPNQFRPVLAGDCEVLPGNIWELQDGQDHVLLGAADPRYDDHAPPELHGCCWVRALLTTPAVPCCHPHSNHHNRPVPHMALNMDFSQTLAAVSAEWWLCRLPKPTMGSAHVFDHLSLIPVSVQNQLETCSWKRAGRVLRDVVCAAAS